MQLIYISDNRFTYCFYTENNRSCNSPAHLTEILLRSFQQLGHRNHRTPESNLFQLTGCTLAQNVEYPFIILYQFADSRYRFPLLCFRQLTGAKFAYQLLYSIWIINRFMFDGRQTVIKHHILHM